MNASELIRRYCPTLEDLAADADLSYPYVKHLAKRNPRPAGELARIKLARAFRRHAARLLADAEELERST